MTCPTISSTDDWSDTSMTTGSPRRPSAPISRADDCASLSLMSATTTSAPRSARTRAIARPIPLPAPVTIATLSVTSISCLLGIESSAETPHRGRSPADTLGKPHAWSSYALHQAIDAVVVVSASAKTADVPLRPIARIHSSDT